MPKCSVIIIHWNTPDALKEQLQILEKSRELEIIVVDNFSSAAVAKKVSALSKKTDHIILNHENAGFAKAGNTGARLAKGEWILFLNPDVQITAEAILDFIKKSDGAGLDAASPSTTDKRYSKPIPTIASLLVEFSPLHRLVPLSLFKTKTLTGGCLLIRRNVFEGVGKWDERFFLWFEDSDLTKRIVDAGYKIGWVDVDMNHTGGISFAHLPDHEQRTLFFSSMKTYAGKHFSRFGNRMVELLSRRFT